MESQRFKVDLGGLVELLSHNLYSSSSVYLRELLQNGVDAITARRERDPDAPARVTLMPWADGEGLTVHDTGVGLSADQASDFLSTIGKSSKRDDLFGTSRGEFLGQFGIGLLAAFMVADDIEVISRSFDNHAPIRWLGSADGTFLVDELSGDDLAYAASSCSVHDLEIGTYIRLRARHDTRHLVSYETVLALATEYASLLPIDVYIIDPSSGESQLISSPSLPWDHEWDSPAQRQAALLEYGEKSLGFAPLSFIDIRVPLLGISGIAYVLPQASGRSGTHRVYTKRMLLSARNDSLLPEWAFFVRAIINADGLTPTASREQFCDDETLLLAREEIGKQLIAWISRTLTSPSRLAQSFIDNHHLALRAMALESSEILEIVAQCLPFETSQGSLTLKQASHFGPLRYTTTLEAYRRVAPVMRAQGEILINGGYVYDADLLARLNELDSWETSPFSSSEVTTTLSFALEEDRSLFQEGLHRASSDPFLADCQVILRSFEPSEVPAILLIDEEAEARRSFEQERDDSGGIWDNLLDSFVENSPSCGRTLVFNARNSTTQLLLSSPFSASFTPGLHAVYLCALMLSGEGLGSDQSRELNTSLAALLQAALK